MIPLQLELAGRNGDLLIVNQNERLKLRLNIKQNLSSETHKYKKPLHPNLLVVLSVIMTSYN
jgi:hypothetical protein